VSDSGTVELFRDDAYLRQCDATVVAIDERGLVTDQTVFYPTGGGQPGDTGHVRYADQTFAVTDCFKDRDSGEHLHILEAPVPGLSVGDRVSVEIDWERRYRLMRMHSCMHMLCAAIPAPVTGGSIQDGRGRLDFDLPDPVDKEQVTAELKRLVEQDRPMQISWITDQELDANPDLVRTMSAPPPRGSGRVRLVNFEGIDLQPCGGTHVASSGEIGAVRVSKTEKKGKQKTESTPGLIAFPTCTWNAH